MKIEKWIEKNCQNLKGKRIAITGSTGGLGKHICANVAGLGGDIILLDRNEKRSKSHAEELREKFGISVENILVDMVDAELVKNACEKLKKQKFDVLILNAGAYGLPREKSGLGFDQVFQINFISPYYIVKELIDKIKENNIKVVVVGSISHKFSKSNVNDVDFSKVKSLMKVYGNAKRYLIYSLFGLFEKENLKSLSIVHPGITPTNITSHYPRWVNAVIKYPMKWVFTSPKKANLNIIKGIFEECPLNTWIGPRGLGIWGKPKLQKLKIDEEEKYRILTKAEEIYCAMKGDNFEEHELGVQEKYYNLISGGEKLYEGRLNDEKRRLINIGDVIEIKKDPERKQSFKAKVVDKLYFKSFYEMAKKLDPKDLGFKGKSATQIAEVYSEFYSKEKEDKYGIVAIKLQKIK